MSKEEELKRPHWKVRVATVVNHWITTLIMTVITVYALFGEDLRLSAFPANLDDIFFSLTTASMIFFTIELILMSIAREGYFLGFFFWLDLISTISLITDIGWIWNEITGTSD